MLSGRCDANNVINVSSKRSQAAATATHALMVGALACLLLRFVAVMYPVWAQIPRLVKRTHREVDDERSIRRKERKARAASRAEVRKRKQLADIQSEITLATAEGPRDTGSWTTDAEGAQPGDPPAGYKPGGDG